MNTTKPKRRGGIAERGSGSLPRTTTTEQLQKHTASDEANDSGYHSDFTLSEPDDLYDIPLSPRSTSPPPLPATPLLQTQQYKHTRSNYDHHRRRRPSLHRKSSWQPNLRRDLELERQRASMRRSSGAEYGASSSEDMESAKRVRRVSTLLHPSSPVMGDCGY
ncbi:hypothetical protein BDW02DRAFT_601135 [Decorospora gaudefroyi]|uniref:Uncharacterized protein n=1 Tax=Decorospora gaudefroyi TaxID=184978 RepID=A0A6A5K150_9PLEO|nr:hypothetical protein BDW02DRAFT_601135 [Decorospora gaudefroyi]